MVVAVVAFVVFMERALRKIHIQYPKRQVGMKIYGGESSNLPIKVNPAGVIPAIFASSLLLLPATITTFSGQSDGAVSGVMSYIAAYMGRASRCTCSIFGALVVFFTYFYTANVAFKSDDVADNLKRQGGFIPGIRPGQKTIEYLDYVVTRILVIGSAYLAAVCLLPEVLISRLRRSLLLRRHFPADRRLGNHGHDHADPVPHARASVRGADREVAPARQGTG